MDVIAPQASVSFETQLNLRDYKVDIYENGEDVIVERRGMAQGSASDTTRGQYGGLKNKQRLSATISKKNIKARVEYNPSIKTLEKTGIRSEVELLCVTAMLDWLDPTTYLSLVPWREFDSIKTTFVIEGIRYVIKDKNRITRIDNRFMELAFGLARE